MDYVNRKGNYQATVTKVNRVVTATMTKLNKDQYVSMEMLVRICRALDCNIGDIVDVIKE